MIWLQKKLVVDDEGRPQEVISPWGQYQPLVEILGLDLDEEAVADLRQGQEDRAVNDLMPTLT